MTSQKDTSVIDLQWLQVFLEGLERVANVPYWMKVNVWQQSQLPRL